MDFRNSQQMFELDRMRELIDHQKIEIYATESERNLLKESYRQSQVDVQSLLEREDFLMDDLGMKTATIGNLVQQVHAFGGTSDADMGIIRADLVTMFGDRNNRIKRLELLVKEKNITISERDIAIAEKDEMIENHVKSIQILILREDNSRIRNGKLETKIERMKAVHRELSEESKYKEMRCEADVAYLRSSRHGP